MRKINKKKFSIQAIWAIVMALLLVGCGASATTPAPTPLPDAPFEVTFDGKECTYSGPTELPVGEYQIILKNETELSWEIGMLYLLDDHTHQDLVNFLSGPGENIEPNEWIISNEWIEWVKKDYVGWDEDDNNIYSFSLNEVGEYSIYIQYLKPESIWLCGSLKVIEATSE